MAWDFDRRQFRLLLSLLATLGSRQEIADQLGLTKQAWLLSRFIGVLIGAFIGLVALGDPPPRAYVMAAIGVSALWLIPQLVSQAANAFMNPAELSVLAHRPVHAGSYLAAKLVYVIRVSLMMTLPLNAIPAIAGASLEGTRWFYPFTHVLAVVLGTMLASVMVCGVLGLLFRMLPVGSVRTAALWAQLVAVTLVPLFPQVLQAVDVPLNLDAREWSAIPVTWFAAIALVGQAGRPPIDPLVAAPAVFLSAMLIVVGALALTDNYLTRASTMMRIKNRGFGTPLVGRAFGMRRTLSLALGPPVRGGAAFVRLMVRRDWQFRRLFLGGSVGIVVLFAIAVGRRFGASPFEPADRANVVQFLPLALGILALNANMVIAFTDRPAAKWIFQVVPASGLRGMVRGTYWGLSALLVGLPYVALGAIGAAYWGAADALLFSSYGVAVTSLFLGASLWLAGGIPFTKAPDPDRHTAQFGVIVLFLLLAGALGALQVLVLFHSRWAALAAAAGLGLAAWVAALASFRVLEDRVLHALGGSTSALGIGRSLMD